MALSFDNGAPLRLLSRREPLSAQAEINFTGTGLLQGEWEVAGPPSTSSEPFYRTLSQVRQYFAAGASQVLKSPALPTDSAGLYYVRFRITDPVPGFEIPVIRYFAGEAGSGKGLPPRSLAVFEPAPSALLASDTAFVWEATGRACLPARTIFDAAIRDAQPSGTGKWRSRAQHHGGIGGVGAPARYGYAGTGSRRAPRSRRRPASICCRGTAISGGCWPSATAVR